MNLRDKILYEVHGDIKKIHSTEDDKKRFNSFLEAFIVDAREYGLQEATEMYGMLFGKETQSKLTDLKENFEVVLEDESLNESMGGDAAATFIAKGSASPLSMMTGSVGASGPTGLLGLWNNIKGLFTGGWTAIKTALSTGNFSALIASPLIHGALAAGGVVLAIKLFKKLFGKAGKKMSPEQQAEIQNKLQKELNSKKLANERNKEKL